MLFTVSGHIRNSIYTQKKTRKHDYNNSLRENAHRKFDAFVIHKIYINGNYRGSYIVK